jgi:hypothetical protein
MEEIGRSCKLEIGTFCISIDLELAWGNWDQLNPEYLRQCQLLERPIVERLTQLFDRYDISATWAIVGHLLKKRQSDSLPSQTAWYAADIIDQIRKTSTPQEIGSHSFAHICYRDSDTKSAYADLEAAKEIHDKHGLQFSSFVYPRDLVGHTDLLSRFGIIVYRSMDVSWYAGARRINSSVYRILSLIDKLLSIPPTVVLPIVHKNGVVELPCSMLLIGRNGLRRLVHPKALEMKVKFGLNSAASKNALFHLRFHPSNFYYQTETQFRVLENILAYACQLRDKNTINICTMGAFKKLPT